MPAAEPPSDGTFEQRLQAVKELIGIFRFERYVYLTVSTLSFAVLIYTAIVVARRQGTIASGEVLGLFGSSGAIGFTGGRLLKMWGDALGFIGSLVTKEANHA